MPVDYERASDGVLLEPREEKFGFTPVNSPLNMHAIRVLSQRAAWLSPGTLLPYHRDSNPKGVNYLKTTVPTLVLWGEYDNMMPSDQAYRLAMLYGNARFTYSMIHSAGHFAAVDQPREVTENILMFLARELSGEEWAQQQPLGQAYFGHGGRTFLWKGDEYKVHRDFDKYFGVPSRKLSSSSRRRRRRSISTIATQ